MYDLLSALAADTITAAGYLAVDIKCLGVASVRVSEVDPAS
jgi:predicted YcjX-like family ATPase